MSDTEDEQVDKITMVKQLLEKIKEEHAERKRQNAHSDKGDTTEKKSKADTVKKKIKTKKQKFLIGWCHHRDGKFKQVRASQEGGLREICFQPTELVTLKSLIEKGVQLFFPNGVSSFGILEDMQIDIGNVKGEIVSKFTDLNGCTLNSFSEHLKCRGMSPSRFPVYLLSRLKDTEPSALNTIREDPCPPKNELELTFSFQSTSLYSSHESTSNFYSIIDCFQKYQLCDDAKEESTNFADFNPLDKGFQIKKIAIGETVYLNVSDQENSVNVLAPPNASFLCYGPEVIKGFNSGKLCIGATCMFGNSNVHFKWIQDGTEIENGLGKCLFFPTTSGVYKCQLSCGEIKEDTVETMVDIIPANERLEVGQTTEPQVQIKLDELQSTAITTSIATPNTSIILPLQQINPLDLGFFFEIGSGTPGVTVHRGIWGATDVAIKKIPLKRASLLHNMIKSELTILGHVRHPHIVQFMAYALQSNNLLIVSELVDGNNLEDILFDEDIKPIYQLSNHKLQIACQCSSALAYLHCIEPMVIHQDIKSANVLIEKSTCKAKLCDMGVSRLKSKQTITLSSHGNIVGTPLYMAPECILDNSKPTTFSDVWSLGCTLVELFSETNIWDIPAVDEPVKHLMLTATVPHALSSVKDSAIQSQLEKCLSYDPMKRPIASEMVFFLKKRCQINNPNV